MLQCPASHASRCETTKQRVQVTLSQLPVVSCMVVQANTAAYHNIIHVLMRFSKRLLQSAKGNLQVLCLTRELLCDFILQELNCKAKHPQ